MGVAFESEWLMAYLLCSSTFLGGKGVSECVHVGSFCMSAQNHNQTNINVSRQMKRVPTACSTSNMR